MGNYFDNIMGVVQVKSSPTFDCVAIAGVSIYTLGVITFTVCTVLTRRYGQIGTAVSISVTCIIVKNFHLAAIKRDMCYFAHLLIIRDR